MRLSNKINFLIGSGASASFGYPSMTEITSGFSNYLLTDANNGLPNTGVITLNPIISVNKNKQISEIYQTILNILKRFYGEKVDIESIMSVVIALKDSKNLKSSIGDIGLYY